MRSCSLLFATDSLGSRGITALAWLSVPCAIPRCAKVLTAHSFSEVQDKIVSSQQDFFLLSAHTDCGQGSPSLFSYDLAFTACTRLPVNLGGGPIERSQTLVHVPISSALHTFAQQDLVRFPAQLVRI